MGHILIAGTTECGKTTLARHMTRSVTSDVDIIVRETGLTAGTPTAGGGWGEKADVFIDDDEFFDRILWQLEKRRPAYVIIDEAGDLFSVQQSENAWILRKGRHVPWQITLIAQRPKMLAPNCRSQCTRYFLFRLAKTDMREMLADCGHELDVLDDSGVYKPLDKGEFLELTTNSADYKRRHLSQITNWSDNHA